jgi:hypothetical protein
VRTIVEIGFWALIGLGCYVIYLALTNAVIDARNEIVLDTEYTQRSTGRGYLSQYGPQIAVALVLMLFLVLAGKFLLPSWLHLVDSLVFDGFSPAHALTALTGYFGLVLTFYTAWMLLEFTLTADQL